MSPPPIFPLTELPDELLCNVTSFLDVTTLNNARSVNHKFETLLSQNGAGWLLLCRHLWRHRVHISPAAQALVREAEKRTTDDRSEVGYGTDAFAARKAYILSCQDALLRQEVLDDELCFDPETMRGTVWSFRFKEAAGTEWTAFDSWHMGSDARNLVFLRDGRVLQLVDNQELRTPFFDRLNMDGHVVNWRHITAPLMDGENRGHGAYIRLEVGGRDVPTYIVRRHTQTWGFTMENCWGIFASFPLPRKPQPRRVDVVTTQDSDVSEPIQVTSRREEEVATASSNNHKRPRSQSVKAEAAAVDSQSSSTQQSERSAAQAYGIVVSDDDDDDTDASPPRPHKRRKVLDDDYDDDLSNDATLSITGLKQWREALLYNLGATTLPDGPEAIDHFNLAWQAVVWLIHQGGGVLG